MRNFVAALALLLPSWSAFGDAIKPATLDISCTNNVDQRIVYIVSNDQGARLLVNTQIVAEFTNQLSAGTEGGPAYLQAVGGGYNVTITGGDFDRAFEDNLTIEHGQANALIWDVESKKTVEGTCKGLFRFDAPGSLGL